MALPTWPPQHASEKLVKRVIAPGDGGGASVYACVVMSREMVEHLNCGAGVGVIAIAVVSGTI